ncbi:MAG TPA: oligosaccharide flippase family protein, partial [Bacteroidota bacterium]
MALYGVQLVNYLLPLVTIPYLARVLGAEGWGLVAFTQGFAGYLIVVIEYGFDLSATREVARFRSDKAKLSDLVAGVLGAKLLLAAFAIAFAITVMPWIPNVQDHGLLLWAGMILAVAQGLSMLWYFQGQERMKVVARLDVMAKVLATISLFVFVREPADAWKVLGLMAAGSLLSTGIALAITYREVPFRLPPTDTVISALRLGWSMFVFRSSVSLYTVGNAFILGFFVPPQFVGYYAGAEKISRAVLGLFQPVSQAMFPRISRLIGEARDVAARYARLSLRVMGGAGFAGGVIMYVSAPLIVPLLLGPEFEPAVTVLRILALLPPLI